MTMKKICALLLFTLLFAAVPALSEAEGTAEWTVLFYMCGSDLESRHGFASEHLHAITGCINPIQIFQILGRAYADERGMEEADIPKSEAMGAMNIVIQTGGSSKWDVEKAEAAISAEFLQRWSYIPGSMDFVPRLNHEEDLPLQSMADPETLSDFIRWGTQTYPAKKYALVLWGHGDGAKTGILSDELFHNDVMHLDELRQALNDGGAFFETVLFDACMMANIETACAIQGNAAWMVASEEAVPGRGSAVKLWLQEMFNHPGQDGRQLGRNICEMTQIAYANTDDEQANSILTWSVIDLSKIPRVDALADRFFELMLEAYVKEPALLSTCASYLYEAEEYGDVQQNMRDIASIFYQFLTGMILGDELRNDMIDALNDAVVFTLRGPGRSEARGLSFCCATDFSNEELDIYARNCMSPHYLAFLDAITPWTAPDWVYEAVGTPPPEINTLKDYNITLEKRMTAQGVPGLAIRSAMTPAGLNYTLYQLDARTGQKKRLGRTLCRAYVDEQGERIWSAVDPWIWPTIDGEFCSIEMIGNMKVSDFYGAEEAKQALYSIPIQIGTETWNLRYGRKYQQHLTDIHNPGSSDYTVYGLWEGYDDDTQMLSRNVKSLSQMAGQEYQLLYPVDSVSGKKEYIIGNRQILYRALNIESLTLPPGTYYLQYEVMDIFMRPIQMEPIEIVWNGSACSYPSNFTWEGTATLQWIDQQP